MCNLQDIIDNSPMIAIEKSAYGDQNEFNRLLQESTIPSAINDKSVSFTYWNFDVAANIHSRAKPNEILEGWAHLSNNNVPLIIYTKAFYIPSLFSWLLHDPNQNIDVDKKTVISESLEPLSSELLRLCFWLTRCKSTLAVKDSFETKFKEARRSLKFRHESEFKKRLNHKLVVFGRIMKDIRIPYWERQLHANELVMDLAIGPFRKNVSTLVPEFMLATLVEEIGFRVSYIPTSKRTKTCDLLVNKSYKIEIKTLLFSRSTKKEKLTWISK
jgi:hypothetical protein